MTKAEDRGQHDKDQPKSNTKHNYFSPMMNSSDNLLLLLLLLLLLCELYFMV